MVLSQPRSAERNEPGKASAASPGSGLGRVLTPFHAENGLYGVLGVGAIQPLPGLTQRL
jgi:hypothetical protein